MPDKTPQKTDTTEDYRPLTKEESICAIALDQALKREEAALDRWEASGRPSFVGFIAGMEKTDD